VIELHPSFLEMRGERQFAVLPYQEFVALQELLEDLEDLRELRAAREAEGGVTAMPLDQVRAALGFFP